MKTSLLYLFLAMVMAAALNSCVKAPNYPIEPQIEFKSVSPVVRDGTNDSIIISFTDGDGDIGVFSNPGDSVCNNCGLEEGDSSCLNQSSFNIMLIDSRDNCVSTFASATIIPSGKYKSLSGDIVIVKTIRSLNCTNPITCFDDTVSYYIMIRDIAGHFSNTVKTTPIAVDVP